jgi:hypothetical protein
MPGTAGGFGSMRAPQLAVWPPEVVELQHRVRRLEGGLARAQLRGDFDEAAGLGARLAVLTRRLEEAKRGAIGLEG